MYYFKRITLNLSLTTYHLKPTTQTYSTHPDRHLQML